MATKPVLQDAEAASGSLEGAVESILDVAQNGLSVSQVDGVLSAGKQLAELGGAGAASGIQGVISTVAEVRSHLFLLGAVSVRNRYIRVSAFPSPSGRLLSLPHVNLIRC